MSPLHSLAWELTWSPLAHSAGFVLQHFNLEGLKCKTFHLVPFHIYVEAPSMQDVQLRLPPLHTNLVSQIMPVPMEEMEPFVQPSNIPVHSWVCLLTSGLKNEIAYVKCIKGNLVYLLVIPWNLPYISGGENSVACQELFDMDLAHQHGLEVGDHGKIQAGEFVNKVAYTVMDVQGESVTVHLDNPTLELPTSLEISIHDFKCKFCSGDSVDIIAGPHHGFEGMVLSVDVIEDMTLLWGNSRQQASQASHRVLLSYPNQDPHNQLQHHPPVEEHFIEPGDTHIKKAFNDKDAKGDKGKSKAQVPDVPGKDSDSNGADNEEVIIFSKEKGWDVSKGNLIQVIWGPAADVKGVVHSVNLITATLTLESEDGPWNDILDVKYGSSWVQIRDTVGCCDHAMTFKNTAVTSRFGILLDGTPLGSSCLAAFNHMQQGCFITQSQCHSTALPPLLSENPSVDPGPSNPWVTTPDDVNLQHHSEQEQQTIDYGCMSWLFDNDFCNFSKWHVCLRVGLAYNCRTLGKQVVCTTIPDHFFSEKHGVAPPGHVLVTMTSSMHAPR
ncbi:hypothetical protein F5J12DRAFT_785986 [Pisolithus orientalis]|uniref:uncharacterized protein n=1 Tax=Pisolithus orientalis TaxID=936130 RepID=UPI00222413EE|nr:uncharacterized protein F5J12DRAFT_785986 [Pisolithus orientalis]KAI5993743.1 hypothetical protein F5J12DRAFT_785986 [Pisolithus orientalis]